MKVILFEENKVAEVSDGYARNYLIPRKLAALVTADNLRQFEKNRAKREGDLTAKRQDAQSIAVKLEAEPLVIPAAAGEEGKLFGTVTSQDISAAIKASLGLDIDKRKINLIEHIRLLGETEVVVKLFHEVTAKVKVNIIAK